MFDSQINLVDIQTKASAFFADIAAVLSEKDARISALEGKLKDALDVINDIVAIRSDFALLKDKTTKDAKKLAEDIQGLLGT